MAGDRLDRPALSAERGCLLVFLPCQHGPGLLGLRHQTPPASGSPTPCGGPCRATGRLRVGNFSEQVRGVSDEYRQRAGPAGRNVAVHALLELPGGGSPVEPMATTSPSSTTWWPPRDTGRRRLGDAAVGGVPQPARFPAQVADPYRQLGADVHRCRLRPPALPPAASGWDRVLERAGRGAVAG